jgi:hypothetical protein
MTGYPQSNFPAFFDAAEKLRAKGAEIVSPAELDSPEIVAETMVDQTGTIHVERWGEFLARDVRLVADEVDGVVCLDGWEYSKGARLEVYVALSCNKPVFRYMPFKWLGMDPIPFVQAADAVTPREWHAEAYKEISQ